MKIGPLHIVTEADLTRMVQTGAVALAERRAASLAKRYAHNLTCLKAAFAARHRLPAEHVIMADGLAEVETRAIVAFADAMGRERGEAA